MKITFLMPCFAWVPSGGFKVVYEYANRLASRGHLVSVVHPRRLAYPPPESFTIRQRARRTRLWARELWLRPDVRWHKIDPRVKLLYVPDSSERFLPDADFIFATAWHTVSSVLHCPLSKGEKCYLIQHYETFMGPTKLVDETWRAPLHKVVVSRWLLELGEILGAADMTHIPNAVDHDCYQVLRPIEQRPHQIAMLFSPVSFKAAMEGIRALELAKRKFPDLCVALFGVHRRDPRIPNWMDYVEDPPQDYIVQNIYNQSSIVLSSSWSEGFALPPAEAALCGCAIVATDSGGIRDFVLHGVTGLLSPPKQPEALARNLCLLLGNDALRTELATAAREYLLSFDWERNADLLEEFLASVSRPVQPEPEFIPATSGPQLRDLSAEVMLPLAKDSPPSVRKVKSADSRPPGATSA